MTAPKVPAAGRHQQDGGPGEPCTEASTQTRVRLTRSQWGAVRRKCQEVVDRLSSLGRDLTDAEQAKLLAALRNVRDISKELARKRGVIMRKGGHHARD